MNIIAADDELIPLQTLLGTIREALPGAKIHGFQKGKEAVEFAEKNLCEIAFLDICMGSPNGIAVAQQLKDINPKINIIFVTKYAKYALKALTLYASGYVMKPPTKDKILKELENLRYPIAVPSHHRLRVQTFGHFEVFADKEPLYFSSDKAKELLALLIDRQGAGLTTPQIAAVLWEDEPYTTYQKNRVQQAIAQLRLTLQKAGCLEVLYKEHNHTGVKTDRLDCDYYEFLKGNTQNAHPFMGEYMAQYSWAEVTTAFLHDKRQKPPV